MSDSPIGATAQPVQYRPDSSNPYLVATLEAAIREGWSLTQLVKTFRWDRNPEWLAGVTKLAQEMGLIAAVQPKAKKSIKQRPEPDDEPLILPVHLRPYAPQPPKPADVIKLSDRREPAPWIVTGDDDE
jgi:hypothetical protein